MHRFLLMSRIVSLAVPALALAAALGHGKLGPSTFGFSKGN